MKRVKDYKHYSVRGLIYTESDLNKIPVFQGETLKHFLAKAILFYKLRRLKHDVLSEVEIPGLGVGDIVDLSANVQYEIELDVHKHIRESKAKKYARKDFDVIVVHCHNLPLNIHEISKYLEQFVVPD